MSIYAFIIGINFNILLYLPGFKCLVKGDNRMAQEPEWYTIPCGYAHQAVLKDVSSYIINEPSRYSTASEAYAPGDHVFLLTQGPHYGCLATVSISLVLKYFSRKT